MQRKTIAYLFACVAVIFICGVLALVILTGQRRDREAASASASPTRAPVPTRSAPPSARPAATASAHGSTGGTTDGTAQPTALPTTGDAPHVGGYVIGGLLLALGGSGLIVAARMRPGPRPRHR